MKKITLARALKYKNRVVERMRKLENDVVTTNSVLQGSERDFDPKAVVAERLALERHLVELKLTLDAANKPIKEAIAKLQELKGRLAFLARINTTHGKVDARRNLYGEQGEMFYEAAIRKAELDNLIVAAQEEIDGLQERIDQYNNTTTIDFEVMPLK